MTHRSRFYLVMAIVLNVVVFWSFSQTYFAPLPYTAIGQAYLQLLAGIGVHLKFLYG